jgi:hypothetical protein
MLVVIVLSIVRLVLDLPYIRHLRNNYILTFIRYSWSSGRIFGELDGAGEPILARSFCVCA